MTQTGLVTLLPVLGSITVTGALLCCCRAVKAELFVFVLEGGERALLLLVIKPSWLTVLVEMPESELVRGSEFELHLAKIGFWAGIGF